MPIMVECVETRVTLGEISHVLREVWGEQRETGGHLSGRRRVHAAMADERRRLLARAGASNGTSSSATSRPAASAISSAPFIGEWSLKDIVGHVATWEAEVVTALREFARGPPPGPA